MCEYIYTHRNKYEYKYIYIYVIYIYTYIHIYIYNVFRSWYRAHSVVCFEQPGHAHVIEHPASEDSSALKIPLRVGYSNKKHVSAEISPPLKLKR